MYLTTKKVFSKKKKKKKKWHRILRKGVDTGTQRGRAETKRIGDARGVTRGCTEGGLGTRGDAEMGHGSEGKGDARGCRGAGAGWMQRAGVGCVDPEGCDMGMQEVMWGHRGRRGDTEGMRQKGMWGCSRWDVGCWMHEGRQKN